MAENKEVKNVFVSHYHEDEDSIKAFKGLLNDRKGRLKATVSKPLKSIRMPIFPYWNG